MWGFWGVDDFMEFVGDPNFSALEMFLVYGGATESSVLENIEKKEVVAAPTHVADNQGTEAMEGEECFDSSNCRQEGETSKEG
jgi:hypothetical protein